MIGNREQQGHYHRDFYRNNYHKALNGLIVLCFIILLLVVAIVYFVLFHPGIQYYATTLSGRIIQMLPLAR